MDKPQGPECGMILHDQHRCDAPLLREAIATNLTPQEARYVRWLANNDHETVDVFCQLFQSRTDEIKALREHLHVVLRDAKQAIAECEEEGADRYRGTDEATRWYLRLFQLCERTANVLGVPHGLERSRTR